MFRDIESIYIALVLPFCPLPPLPLHPKKLSNISPNRVSILDFLLKMLKTPHPTV
jgi:hypothetical protein